MSEEFEIQKLKSEYPEFFVQVSPDLLEFIFSEETSSKIAEICLENGIEDEEKIEKIAYRVTLALLEQVPKENLAEILEKGVEIDFETAEKISIEIKQLIFSQIPETQPKEIQKEEDQIEEDEIEEDELTQPEKPSPPVTEKEEPEKPSKKDVYREPVG
jgi:hypothetical protein